MPLANLLSWSRIVVTPVVMGLLALWDWPPSYIIAAIIWVLAQITDVLDGYFARRQKTVSNLGIFLDLTADKLFVAGVLIILTQQQVVSGWLVAIILMREFLITGVRTYAAAEGVVIPAGKWGKRKTVFTAIAITWLMVWADAVMRPQGLLHDVDSIKIGDFQAFHWFFELAWPLMYWVVFLTIFSGYIYMKNAAYLFSDQRPVTQGQPPKPATPTSDTNPKQTSPGQQEQGMLR